MHYEHLDDLEPHFRKSIEGYLHLCPIEFENPGEALVTAIVDGVSEDDLIPTCSPLIKYAIGRFSIANPQRVAEFLDTLMSDIFLVGGPQMSSKIAGVAECLSEEQKELWRNIEQERRRTEAGFY